MIIRHGKAHGNSIFFIGKIRSSDYFSIGFNTSFGGYHISFQREGEGE